MLPAAPLLLFVLAATAPDADAPPDATDASVTLAQEGDRLEDDLDDVEVPPPPPPPPAFDDPADDEDQRELRESDDTKAPPPTPSEPGESVAPPAPDAPPGPPVTPLPSSGRPVNRLLAAGLTSGLGVGCALPASGCCLCCGWAGCLAPSVAGAAGTGGGALLGAWLADVPLRDAWLPALAALGLGLGSGLLALPCGCLSFNVVAILLGRSTQLPPPVPTQDGTLLLASSASAMSVLAVLGAGALGGGGLMYLLLPEEVEPERPKATKRRSATTSPALRHEARAIAY